MTGQEPKIWTAKLSDMPVVAALFRAYLDELGVDLSFQQVAAELAGLPGPYAAPAGCILLAGARDATTGVVALKPLATPGVCELKRLYVLPKARGQGVAEHLCLALEEQARRRDYAVMKLDTLARLGPANRLYERLGYEACAPYNENPYPDILYFQKALRPAAMGSAQIGD